VGKTSKERRQENLARYMEMRDKMDRHPPSWRVSWALDYYTMGATIQCLRSMVSVPRKRLEGILQKLEREGMAVLLHVVSDPEDLLRREARGCLVVAGEAKAKRWIRPGNARRILEEAK